MSPGYIHKVRGNVNQDAVQLSDITDSLGASSSPRACIQECFFQMEGHFVALDADIISDGPQPLDERNGIPLDTGSGPQAPLQPPLISITSRETIPISHSFEAQSSSARSCASLTLFDSQYCQSDLQSVVFSYLSSCVTASCLAFKEERLLAARDIYSSYCSSNGYHPYDYTPETIEVIITQQGPSPTAQVSTSRISFAPCTSSLQFSPTSGSNAGSDTKTSGTHSGDIMGVAIGCGTIFGLMLFFILYHLKAHLDRNFKSAGITPQPSLTCEDPKTRKQQQTFWSVETAPTTKSDSTEKNNAEDNFHPNGCKGLSPASGGILIRIYKLYLSKFAFKFWPDVTTGCTRVQWTCGCGTRLYEDYATSSAGMLPNPNISTGSQNSTPTAPDGDLHSQDSFSTSSEVSYKLPSSPDLEARLSEIRPSGSGLKKMFLALCVNTGHFHTTLCEINVSNIHRDDEIFNVIKSRYCATKGFKGFNLHRLLLRPTSAHFAKINVEDSCRADIITKPSIPPKSDVLSGQYAYSPLDLAVPPITSNSFLHYMENPSCASLSRSSRWFGYLPKRVGSDLLTIRRSSPPNVVVTGWGVHIDEGVNGEGLFWLAFCVLALSLAVGVAYWIVEKDFSGGFTVAAYIVAVVGVLITLMYLRWQ